MRFCGQCGENIEVFNRCFPSVPDPSLDSLLIQTGTSPHFMDQDLPSPQCCAHKARLPLQNGARGQGMSITLQPGLVEMLGRGDCLLTPLFKTS